jgi:4,5-DOPA dioxygenase extradiol
LSINALKPKDYHVTLGARLAPLRERGVLIIGSGNVVHNLRRIDWRNRDGGEDWAYRLDDAAASLLSERPGDIGSLQDHADYGAAVPTPDHFLPLLYLAGIAAESGAGATALVRGCTLGTISMSCYGVGAEGIGCTDGSGAAGLPRDVPADQSNL